MSNQHGAVPDMTEATPLGTVPSRELEIIGLSKTFRWQKKGVPA